MVDLERNLEKTLKIFIFSKTKDIRHPLGYEQTKKEGRSPNAK